MTTMGGFLPADELGYDEVTPTTPNGALYTVAAASSVVGIVGAVTFYVR